MAKRDSTPQPDHEQPTIKAIETHYHGYRFRSRLEARWAVFLDALGMVYQYEPEGYDLDGVLYLPDFYLPALSCWLEVKGGPVTDDASHKAYMLCRSTQKMVLLAGDHFNGDQPPKMWRWNYMRSINDFSGVRNHPDMVWAQCKRCYVVQPVAYIWEIQEYSSIGEDNLCKCVDELGEEFWSQETEVISSAYSKARRARFEHGEKPRR